MQASATPLALIVPVGGEAGNLAGWVDLAERHLPPPFTVYMIYDDALAPVVAAAQVLAARRPWLRLVRNEDTPGLVGAVRTGFRTVGAGPALVTTADAGDDLSIVSQMLSLYRQGYRIVCPSRFARGGRQIGGSAGKRILLRALGVSFRFLVRFPTHDLNNNYRLYDAGLVNDLGIESTEGSELALELTAKAFCRGVRITEIPTTWIDRRASGGTAGTVGWLARYVRWCAYVLRGRRARRGE